MCRRVSATRAMCQPRDVPHDAQAKEGAAAELNSLDLHDNPIGNAGATKVVELIGPHLEELDLSACELRGDDVCVALAAVVRLHTPSDECHLTEVCLARNHLGDRAIKLLCQACHPATLDLLRSACAVTARMSNTPALVVVLSGTPKPAPFVALPRAWARRCVDRRPSRASRRCHCSGSISHRQPCATTRASSWRRSFARACLR